MPLLNVLQLTNSMDWSLTHLEGLKDICKHQVQINQPLPLAVVTDQSFTDYAETQMNNTNYIPSTAVTVPTAFTPEFLAKIEAASCTNECSGEGTCENGSTDYVLFCKNS